MMNYAVRVDDLRVVRGRHEVLRGLTFQIPVGQVTGLLGPSGCGKSTLMRSLVGVQAQVVGTVTVLGEPAGSASLRDRLGYVTQAPSVYDDLSIRENLTFFARVLGRGRDDVDRCIDTVGLSGHVDRVVGELSGGQRSRASLAVALLGGPELLVLDEPTVGLDPVLREELWGSFSRLAGDGITVIVSSHVMDEATRCDRLLLMRDGSLLADGTPAEITATAGVGDVEAAFLAIVGNNPAGGRS